MKITTIGIDLTKNVFQVHGVDERGKAVLRKQLDVTFCILKDATLESVCKCRAERLQFFWQAQCRLLQI